MFTTFAGAVGLIVQLAIGLFTFALLPNRSVAFRALAGSVAATYGYGLAISAGMFLAIPWQFSNLVFALALSAALLSQSIRAQLRESISELLRTGRRNWAAASVLIGATVFQFFVAGLKPELSVDGQLYHGPLLSNLVSTGTLWGWSATNQYVYYTDLTMATTVNLATFTNFTWFDDAAQVPHLLVLMLAVNWGLRQRFSSAFLRVAIAALIVTASVIWTQPRVLYVDLAYGAAVTVAMLLIAMVRHWGTGETLLAGIAIAGALATKPAGVLTGAVLFFALVIALAVWAYRQYDTVRLAWVPLIRRIGLVVIPAVMGLAFYLRNFVSFSNPIYPVKASIGRIQFPGIIDMSVFTSGDQGSGFVDLSRLKSYLNNIRDGVLHGVTKLDYDPRSGGFGHMPEYLAIIVVILLLIELVIRIRARGSASPKPMRFWPMQLVMTALACTVLLVQPSTFDSRYVIGPTVVLALVGALFTLGAVIPILLQTLVGVLALLLALVQVRWTEAHVYTGLKSVLDLRGLSATSQPLTPGNPWGSPLSLSWLPQDDSCRHIAIETQGGIAAWGNPEVSQLAILSYGLAGPRLCNTVVPVVLTQYETSSGVPTATTDPFGSASYFIANEEHVPNWTSSIARFGQCWTPIQQIPAFGYGSQNLVVFKNQCTFG